MTPPSPEAVAAAVELIHKTNLEDEGEDVSTYSPYTKATETILSTLAAQSEALAKITTERDCWIANAKNLQDGYNKLDAELANHYHDFKRIRQLMMCDGSDFEQLESKWNSVQAELAQARKDVEILNWADMSKRHALATFTDEELSQMPSLVIPNGFRKALYAAMKQEQK